MQLTINQIIDELRIWTAAHLQLNEMAYGDLLDIYNSNTIQHAILCANVNNVTIDKDYINLILSVAVFDRVADPSVSHLNRAQHEVESDTLQILNDLYETIQNSPRWGQSVSVFGAASAQKFVEANADRVTGWVMDIPLAIIKHTGLCELPLLGYDYEGEFEAYCSPVKIYENGTLVATVGAGGVYNYATTSGGTGSTFYNYFLENTASLLLASGNTSASTLSLTAPDATFNVYNSELALVSGNTIPSSGTSQFVIPDFGILLTTESAPLAFSSYTFNPDLDAQSYDFVIDLDDYCPVQTACTSVQLQVNTGQNNTFTGLTEACPLVATFDILDEDQNEVGYWSGQTYYVPAYPGACGALQVTFNGYIIHIEEEPCSAIVAFSCDTLVDAVIISGAGDEEVNGIYFNTKNQQNGQDIYQTITGFEIIWNGTSSWQIVDDTQSIRYYISSTSDLFTTSWVVSQGTSPAPTSIQATFGDLCAPTLCDLLSSVTDGQEVIDCASPTLLASLESLICEPQTACTSARIVINTGQTLIFTGLTEACPLQVDFNVLNESGQTTGYWSGGTYYVPNSGTTTSGETIYSPGMPIQTNITFSGITGDDGDTRRGADFFVLPANNLFGNTDRFTDVYGGQNFVTYGNVVVDWYTYNSFNNTVDIWDANIVSSAVLSAHTAAAAIHSVTASGYTFSGWNVANCNEFAMIQGGDGVGAFNYAPFSITTVNTGASSILTSTAINSTTTVHMNNAMGRNTSANPRRTLFIKKINVSEIGL